jgi:phage FluMu protein Com
MPIEFRCNQCQKLLRTGDETAGKQARCPECGQVTPVPSAPPAAPTEGEPAGPAFPPGPEGAPSDPFGPAAGQPTGPFAPGSGPAGPANPYVSPAQTGQPPQYGPAPVGAVPNYLVQAILCTIFCCLPFGVVAIVFAAQVNGQLASGNYQAALASSNSARMWCWVSFWLGIIPIGLWLMFICAGGMAGGF